EYDNSLLREKNVTQSERQLNKQHELAAINLVEYAGLGLDNNNKAIVLFGILRGDTKPEDVQYHHGPMNDAMLFANALRMAEELGALNKLKEAYHKPNQHCPICLKVPVTGEGCR
ncbi:MAG: hypothetical protein Q7S12_02205, partial [bacterium]|nr:hypothetical protein [bacterium]